MNSIIDNYNKDWNELREGIKAICKNFPEVYWQELDRNRSYPTKFVNELTKFLFRVQTYHA